MASQNGLPRFRGFNLLDAFTTKSSGDFLPRDFEWIAEWGFNFVRLPLCYTLWIEKDDPYQLHEPMLRKIDQAVELGRQHNLHVCLNFHRAPGYSVNAERSEPFNLWKDQPALDAFCFHWRHFAQRYRGIPSSRLSFNLVNEPENPNPNKMTRKDHERVMRTTVQAVREIDPDRLIILDGLSWGNEPLFDLADLPNVAQSCRAYAPFGLTHYKAPWAGGERFPLPVWPGGLNGDMTPWGREQLEEFYQPWGKLAQQGVGIHCGEGGAFKFTPHSVLLTWLRDVLEILTSMNIGLSLWNFRGSFGLLDSQREGTPYEPFHGHHLDRQLLELLQQF